MRQDISARPGSQSKHRSCLSSAWYEYFGELDDYYCCTLAGVARGDRKLTKHLQGLCKDSSRRVELPVVASLPRDNFTLMAEPPDGANLSVSLDIHIVGGSPGTAAAMEDSPAMGGWIWIVRFAMVMVISVIANFVFVLTVLQLSNEKKHTVTHFIICVLFLVKLVDYGLLIFEFILGISHHYPYGDTSCALYQFLLQGNPLLSSGSIFLLVYQAHSSSSLQSSFAGPAPLSPLLSSSPPSSSCPLLFVSIPSALFSAVSETSSGARYCVKGLTSVAVWTGLGPGSIPTALYYLIRVDVLASPGPGTPRGLQTLQDDQYNLLHVAIVFIRHVADFAEISMSDRTGWIISVAQSLF